MQNPVARLVRSVVQWFHRISEESLACPSRARQQAVNSGTMEPFPPRLTPEEFRRMFQESIANDPDMVRQLLRPLVGDPHRG